MVKRIKLLRKNGHRVVPPGFHPSNPPPGNEECVTVALKIPNGIILQLHAFTEVQQLVMGGGTRVERISHPIEGTKYFLFGSADFMGADPRRKMGEVLQWGYGITRGIPKKIWDAWKLANADSELIKNELIFAYGKPEKTISHAKSNEDELTGLEPVSVNTQTGEVPDPRWKREPGSRNPHITFGSVTRD